jgi:hypothetical protein
MEEGVGGGGCKGYGTLHENINHKCFEKLPSPFGRRVGDEGLQMEEYKKGGKG